MVIIVQIVRDGKRGRDAIADFVADGGRPLLAVDSTRPVPEDGKKDVFPSLYSTLLYAPTLTLPSTR